MPSAIVNIRFDVEASGGVGSVGYFGAGYAGASLRAQGGAQGAFSTRPFSASGQSQVGAVGSLSVVLGRSAFTLSATGSEGVGGRAYLVAPSFRSLFGVYSDSMPLFSLRATAQEVIEAIYRAYAVNAKNAAMTEYLEFPFNHIAIFEGQAVVFATDSAYVLGGDLDEGIDIDSMFELPPNDFGGSNLKRMPYMYIGSKTNAAMQVTVVADETEALANLTATNGRNRRAKMARGIKARYWAARVENVDGEDFAIDSIEYLPMALGRKV